MQSKVGPVFVLLLAAAVAYLAGRTAPRAQGQEETGVGSGASHVLKASAIWNVSGHKVCRKGEFFDLKPGLVQARIVAQLERDRLNLTREASVSFHVGCE